MILPIREVAELSVEHIDIVAWVPVRAFWDGDPWDVDLFGVQTKLLKLVGFGLFRRSTADSSHILSFLALVGQAFLVAEGLERLPNVVWLVGGEELSLTLEDVDEVTHLNNWILDWFLVLHAHGLISVIQVALLGHHSASFSCSVEWVVHLIV